MPSILFVHNHLARFVAIDRDLLAERWKIQEWYERTPRVNLAALAEAVRRSDFVFGWFASWHTFWPVTLAWLLRKPSVVVVGGYDVANIPSIGYGHQRGGLPRWVARWVAQHAAALVTNSKYSLGEIKRNLGLPEDRVHMIYHGIPDPFGCLPFKPAAPLVLTVGNVDRPNLWRKGLLPFVRAAALLPDIKFVVVGAWKDKAIDALRAVATPNVLFTGQVSDKDLLNYYQAATVYVQASAHEGFGLSVAEAMLAGCIPVVSRGGALPEIVGDTGIFIPNVSPEAVADGIHEAMSVGGQTSSLQRERITALFPVSKRRQGLFTLLDELADRAS